MSAPAARARARRPRRSDRDIAFLVGNIAFIDALLAIGAASAWAIYRSGWFVLVAAVAIVVSTGIALLAVWRPMRWWQLALITAGAYIVVGVPVAAPTMITDPATILPGIWGVVSAPVTGWKNLLTLELPLGVYQTTLALPLFLMLSLGTLALLLALRAPRLWVLAAPLALVITAFGVLFGSSAVDGSWRIGAWELDGVWEAVVGLGALLTGFAWYVWRNVHTRRVALRVARTASGVRSSVRVARTLGSRIALAAGMLVVALALGLALAPWAIAGSSRDVLRTAVDPVLKVRQTLSPLADYRAAFSDERFGDVLFTVAADSGVDRVRLATLSYYDGRVMRATDPQTGDRSDSTEFRRVPASLPADTGDRASATFTIGDYTGIWVPAVGDLTSIDFSGSTRAALSDGFFYNPESATGVELSDPGLASGVTYTQTGVVTDAPRDPGTLTPSRSGTFDPAFVPESLEEWVSAQDAPSGGAGLVELISRLRARGLLSHALTLDPGTVPMWAQKLGDYTFEPSRSGHSTDRIGDLFSELLKKQNETGGTDDSLLVSAAGDDEQFAVAGALIADHLGFPARVVLGTRLSSDDADLPVCEDGTCTSGDLAAWIEVRDADGTWTAIDTTPQHRVPLSPDIQQRRDPQNMTPVEPEQADTVLPPEADPADATPPQSDEPTDPLDLAWLWATLRISGIVIFALLILLMPAIAVLAAKIMRRRARRSSADPVDRVVGGWEEYLDTVVDHGHRIPPAATRSETASAVDVAESTDPATLAALADRAVFAPGTTTEAESTRFWELIDQERQRFASTGGLWTRWKARLSLRSFARGLREAASRDGRGRP